MCDNLSFIVTTYGDKVSFILDKASPFTIITPYNTAHDSYTIAHKNVFWKTILNCYSMVTWIP